MMYAAPPPSSGTEPSGRIAAIDVGSNAIRFMVAQPLGHADWKEIDCARVAIRLGTSVFESGGLDPDRIDEAVAAFAGFRRRMDAAGAELYRAVATSAVRDSPNGDELVRRIYSECAIRLEPIPGEEEARLVWLAIRNRLGDDERPRALVDLGGGSMEISVAAGDRLISSQSYRIGAVRMLARLGPDGARDPEAVRSLLDADVALSRVADAAPGWRAVETVATGGNIDALADIARAPLDPRGFRILRRDRIGELITTLASLSPAERASRWGLRPDRADVILPAAIVYDTVAGMIGVDRIVVAGVGVKEGILLDLLAEG